jgi:hypothetical protein
LTERIGGPAGWGGADGQDRARSLFRWHVDGQDWWFVPVWAVWLVVNLGLYPAYPQFLVRAGVLQSRVSEIFPYTWASSLLLFVYGVWLFRVRYRLDYLRSVVYALSLSFAATSLFEILYQNIGAGAGVGNQQLEGQLINLSAIALALSTVRFWRVSKPWLVAVLAFAAGWVAWRAVGYPQIYDSDPALAREAYAFNAGLKVGAYVVLGLLVSFAGRLDGPVSTRSQATGANPSGSKEPRKSEADVVRASTASGMTLEVARDSPPGQTGARGGSASN